MPKENRIVQPDPEKGMCEHLSRHLQYLNNYQLQMTMEVDVIIREGTKPRIISKVSCFKCGGEVVLEQTIDDQSVIRHRIGFDPSSVEEVQA